MTSNFSVDQAQENLCQATNILIKKQLEALQFDITVDATVVDASKAEMGIYSVSTGQATFIVYNTSDIKYKKDDKVMVTIPQGDYDKQKFIIGKQVEDENTPINYKSSFEQLVDVTGNLITGEHQISLWANGGNTVESKPGEEYKQYGWDKNSSGEDFSNSTAYKYGLIWDSGNISNKLYTKYNYLGIKAQFSTWLREYETIAGNYGLAIELTYDTENGVLTQFNIFDSDTFFGNIYDFESYYTQEAIFDISAYQDYLIKNIKIYAYQRNNFIKNDRTLIYNPSDIESSWLNNIYPNIFIKDPYICLGFSTEDFNRDSVKILVQNNNFTYAKTSVPMNQRYDYNKKILNLQWIHKDENSDIIKTILDDDIPNGYHIYWYRYKLGAPRPDNFVGAHWTRFYGCRDYPDDQGDYCISSNNEEGSLKPTKVTNISFNPNVNNSIEKLKVVIVKTISEGQNEIIAISPIVEFTNENNVSSDITIIDANALGIRFEDEEAGNYFIYDKTGKILNNKNSEIRKLTVVYGEDMDFYNKEVLENDRNPYDFIKWIFPSDNTMIIPLTPEGNKINKNINYFNESSHITITYNNQLKTFELLFERTEEDLSSQLNSVNYLINESLDFSKSRNTVYVQTRIDGKLYTAQVSMLFGNSGTSGSEYTIITSWDNNAQGVFEIKEQVAGQELQESFLSGSVHLELQGKRIDLDSSAEFNYSWYKTNVDETRQLLFEISGDNNSYFKIIPPDQENLPVIETDLYILQIDLIGFGDYKLTTCYPIAFKKCLLNEIEVDNIEGPVVVRYSTDGMVNFDKDTYKINFRYYEDNNWIQKNEQDLMGYWKLLKDPNEEIDSITIPKITETNSVLSLIKAIQDSNILKPILIALDNTLNNSDEINGTSIYESIENIDPSLIEEYNNMSTSLTLSDLKEYYKILNIREILNIVEKLKEKFPSFQNLQFINPILTPTTIYLNNTPLYGMQFILDTFFNNRHIVQTLWSQPIYIYQDNYPSETINRWDGDSITEDSDSGVILARGLAVGKKDENNKLSGLILGDWSKTNTDESITKQTGIYGLHQGAMSYAFKEDGTAFIGKNGAGRIEFNGNKGIIKSALYQENEDSLLDINNIVRNYYNDDLNAIFNNTQQNSINFKTGTKIDLSQGLIDIWGVSLKENAGTIEENNQLRLQIQNSNQYRQILSSLSDNERTKIADKLRTLYSDQTGAFTFNSYDNNKTIVENYLLYKMIQEEKYGLSQYIKSSGSHIQISSKNPYFTISSYQQQGNNKPIIITPLIYIGDDKYYLQSANYLLSNDSGKKQGTYFDLTNGKLEGYNFSLKSETESNNKNYLLQLSSFGTSEDPFIKIGRKIKFDRIIAIQDTSLEEYYDLQKEFTDLVNSWYDKYILNITTFQNFNNIYNIMTNSSLLDLTTYKNLYAAERTNLNNEINRNYFDEIPNLLLHMITEEQLNNLLLLLESFDNSEENPLQLEANIINEKNLIYPKFYIENQNSLQDRLFQYEMSNYNNTLSFFENYLRENSDNLDSEEIENQIGLINDEATKLIRKFNFQRGNSFNKIIINDYNYETRDIQGNIYDLIIINPCKKILQSSSDIPQLDNSQEEGISGYFFSYNNKYGEERENNTSVYIENQLVPIEGGLYEYRGIIIPSTLGSIQIVYQTKNSDREYVFYKGPNLGEIDSSLKDIPVIITFDPENKNTSNGWIGSDGVYSLKDKDLSTGIFPKTSIKITPVTEVNEIFGQERIKFSKKIEIKDYNETLLELTKRVNKNTAKRKYNNYLKLMEEIELKQNMLNFKLYQLFKKYLQTKEINLQNKKYFVTDYIYYSTKTSPCYYNNLGGFYFYLNTSSNIADLAPKNFKIIDDYCKFDSTYQYFEIDPICTFTINGNNAVAGLRRESSFTLEEILSYFYVKEDDYFRQARSEDFFETRFSNGEVVYKFREDIIYAIKAFSKQSFTSYYNTDYELQMSGQLYNNREKNIDIYTLSSEGIRFLEEEIYNYEQEHITIINDEDEFSFDKSENSWQNDLIQLNKNGGYMTSKDYRPTILSGINNRMLNPTDTQDPSSSDWRQGMKGFIIDFTNNRIVLGNNSKIEGYQTQYYPGQTSVQHRSFSISSGATFSFSGNRDRITDNSYFIRAKGGWKTSPSSLSDVFYVKWNGDVYIQGNLTVKGLIKN